jgi:PAS domain S-box-containing protein
VPVLVGVVSLTDYPDQVLAYLVGLQPKQLFEYRQFLEEAHFQLLAENIPQLVNVCDSEGRIIYSNRRYLDYTGLNVEDGQVLWDWCVHPGDVELMRQLGQKCREDRSIFECEARLRAHDGSYRWYLILSVPIFNADGAIREWFGTCTDIDDKKRQQDEIRESELRFRMLADAIPQIVWSADASGKFTFFNHRWTEFTGLSVEQSLDDAWTLLIHPDDLPVYLSEWNKALGSGDSYEVEFRLKRAIGVGKVSGSPYRWHLGRAVALRSSTGKIVEWFGTWTEIEPQKRRNS